ncbi:unnamed protein product [Owenia fusiformis]|uniref:Uncharacterized protein n=1 Tax=Owenia fusiformis TaxID=6347 RepID=A0A8J1T5L4_OWEFU|nr:unnamed protein product [Owenia fusiformis]
MAASLSELLSHKMIALEESVKHAEKVAKVYKWNGDLKEGDVDYINAKTVKENDTNFEMNHHFQQRVNMNASSVHIPVEIFEGDIEILNGLEWSRAIEDQWKKNAEDYPDLLWQYFGSQQGFMRNYPASKWRREGVDLYDVRRRPWYTQGASSPKDMLILIDTSGSTHGQALQLMKTSVKSLLDTLGENDFVNIVHFSQKAEYVVSCFQTFVQANYRNKAKFFDAVDSIQSFGMASFANGFTFAFEEFIKFNATFFDDLGEGAHCNRIIMLFTDGGTEEPEDVFKKYNWPEKKVRVFTYAVGPAANPVASVRWAACANRGYFSTIPAMGAIRSTVQKYQEFVEASFAYGNVSDVLYTSTYNDGWGLGMMTTLTLPVYNRSEGGNQTLLGVMGTDVTTKEMMELAPRKELGQAGYVFAINGNGYVVFHPNLKAQNGWLEDPPNMDLLEVEYDSEEKDAMRRKMIDQETGSATLDTLVEIPSQRYVSVENRQYYYAPIENSTFSLGLVVPSWASHYITPSPITSTQGLSYLQASEISDIYFANWDFCSNISVVSNISTPMEDFFNTLENEYEKCDDALLQHLFWDAEVTKNMDSWWESNAAMINRSFIGTAGGLTRMFPKDNNGSMQVSEAMLDTWKFSEYKRAYDTDNFIFIAPYKTDDDSENTTMPLITMYKSIKITSPDTYYPAVIGTDIELAEFLADFENMVACRGGEYADSLCFILDDGGFIISTNQNKKDVGRFLGYVDPSLMNILFNTTVYKRIEEFDFQASCPEDDGFTSAGFRSIFIPTLPIAEMLTFKWWSTAASWAYMNYNIFNMFMAESDDFVYAEEEPKNKSCIKKQAQYYYGNDDPTFTLTYEFPCENCSRSFTVARIQQTNLLLVSAEKDDCEECDHSYPVQVPTEDDGPDICETKKRYRKRPTTECYDYDPNEDSSLCGATGITVSIGLLVCVQTVLLLFR